MPVRLRKFIGLVLVIPAFMVAYVIAASTLSDHIPDHWAARLAFYAIVGTAWGVPLFPLFKWMNRVPRPPT